MLRKKKSDNCARRARLDVSNGEELEDTGCDPIAAVLEERKRKQEESLRAAAAAAAKRAAANLTTYFADDVLPAPASAINGGLHSLPPAAQSTQGPAAATSKLQNPAVPVSDAVTSASEDPPHSTSPLSPAQLTSAGGEVPGSANAEEPGSSLASLLGYSYDDGSGSEAGDEEAHEGAAGGQDKASEDGDSNMDAELADFMEELESSGLLKEDDSAAQPSSGVGGELVNAALSSEAPSSSAPAEARQADTEKGDRAAATEAVATSGIAQAEQRVLGSLEGCLGWHEVMDMSSGRVYFWNEGTDEVAWDPPEGSMPRSKQQNNATFAAAHGAPEAEAASNSARDPDSSLPAMEKAKRSAEAAVSGAGAPHDVSAAAQDEGSGPAGGQEGQLHEESAAHSDQEEGELAERAAAVERPAEEVGRAGEVLLASAWEAAQRICGPVPLLVRLAVEVEVRLRDWRTFSDAQRRAADSGELGGALSWASYQRSVQESWRSLQAALPMALQDAEAGLAAATAAMADASAAASGAGASQAPEAEDGELPDDSKTSSAAPTRSLVPRESAAPADLPPPADAHEPVPAPLPANAEDDDVDMELDDSPVRPQPASKPLQTQAAPAAAQMKSGSVAATAAAAPQPAQPLVMAPLPAPAPQWPGFYVPYAHYMHPRPFYAPQPFAVPTSASLAAAALPAQAPPLPADNAAQPPLPEDHAGGVQSASDPVSPPVPGAQPRAKEYRAEPVRAVTPPSPQGSGAPSGADAGALPAPPGEEERKRKREKATVGTGPLAKKKKALKVGKATSSLIDKWAAVRKDLVEEEENFEVPDAEALECKRLREAEEWRLKQLRAGVSSEDNSNFQPLAVDWREKLKATKAAAELKQKPVSTKQAPVTYSKKPDLEALSVGLPAGWKALWDKTSKEVYYANPKTKETSWEKPT